jgi:hypothetical protein
MVKRILKLFVRKSKPASKKQSKKNLHSQKKLFMFVPAYTLRTHILEVTTHSPQINLTYCIADGNVTALSFEKATLYRIHYVVIIPCAY